MSLAPAVPTNMPAERRQHPDAGHMALGLRLSQPSVLERCSLLVLSSMRHGRCWLADGGPAAGLQMEVHLCSTALVLVSHSPAALRHLRLRLLSQPVEETATPASAQAL